MTSKIIILVLTLVIVVALTACGGANATSVPPTLAVEPTRTSAPPIVITATSAPTNTPAATNTAPPTNTAGPTSASATNTVVPTATNTRVPPTATRPPQPTAVPIKYGAPNLLEPTSSASRTAGKDALIFKWVPVGDLDTKECYQLQVAIVNPVDNTAPGKQYITGCNWNSSQGNLTFTLSNKPTGENYIGLLAEATRLSNPNTLKVDWSVTVVLDQGGGKYAPLSPASQTIEFVLQNP